MIAPRRAQLRGDLALLSCAAIWGATFPIIEAALEHASPLVLNALRFTVGALLLVGYAFGPHSVRRPGALLVGAGLGALLAGGYALQTVALPEIGPSRSAFLTAFYVIFTPFLDWVFFRRRPGAASFLGAVVALAGVAVMTGAAFGQPPGWGDVLTLGCALFFAAHIVALGRALETHRAGFLAVVQIAACGLICAGGAPILEAPRLEPTVALVAQIVFLGAIATALILGLQSYGQRRTTAAHAAVLFASEPVWALGFSILGGTPVTGREVIGGAVVLAGILVATVPHRRPSTAS